MPPHDSGGTKRRTFLRVVGSTGIVGASTVLAGCTSGGDDPSMETTTTTTAESDAEIQKGGSITVAVQSGADTLHIHKLADTTGANIGHNISNTLVDVNKDGEIVPDLATEVPEPSNDGTTYTFKLHEGVQFHKPYDREMTADDVVWNFRKILDENYGGWGRTHFVGILVGKDSDGNTLDPTKTVKKTGKYEVTFNLPHAYAPFLYKVAKYANGIIPKESLEEHGKNLGSPKVGAWGTGSFMFKDAVAGESYTLERNPNYFKEGEGGKLPYLDEITFQIVPKASVRQTGLKTGNFDVNEAVSPKDVEKLKSSKNINIKSRPSTQRMSMWVNQRNRESMGKKKVRKALAYGMNKEAIIGTKFMGLAAPSKSVFPPWHWAYNEDAIVDYPHQPEKAKSLLKEVSESGLKFNCSPENDPMYVDTATIMQQNYSQIGVNMEVTPKSSAAAWDPLEGGWSDKSIPPKSWNAMVAAYTWGFSADDYSYSTFHKGGWNYSYYDNKKVNEWTEEARQTTDRSERQNLYDKVSKQVTDDMPKIFVVWPNINLGVSKSVHNVPVYPNTLLLFEEAWKES